MDVSHMREVLVLAEHLNYPNIARLAACISDIRQHVM